MMGVYSEISAVKIVKIWLKFEPIFILFLNKRKTHITSLKIKKYRTLYILGIFKLVE